MSRPSDSGLRPSSRNGVGASRVAMQAGPWTTVLDFLSARLPKVSRGEWQTRLSAGDVVDAQGRAVAADAACQPPEVLYYYRCVPFEAPVPFAEVVVHQDAHLVVADKPHFLSVTPGGRHVQQTLLVRLRQRLGLEGLTPLHRIDRETAGLVAFSVNPLERNRYHALFRDRQVEKHYEAIAGWDAARPVPEVVRSCLAEREDAFMQMHEIDGPANSETRIEVLEVRGDRARYRLTPLTGRKHQLRAHMASIGRPIIGDRIYPVLQPESGDGCTPDFTEPLRLLAKRLAFDCPFGGGRLEFESRMSLQF